MVNGRFLILLALVILQSCDGVSLKNEIKLKIKNPNPDNSTHFFGETMGVKVAPGIERSTGSNAALKAAVTTDGKKVSGSQISGVISINSKQSR